MPTCRSCGHELPELADRCLFCQIDSEAPTRAPDPDAPSASSRPTESHGALLAPGHFFGNRYRIIRSLGTGGMGAVYQAWDDELQIAVALKVVRSELVGSSALAKQMDERFKRELLLARQVTHKNVVRIYDIGEIEHVKYITMSYVHGSDLLTLLTAEKKLSIERTLALARQIAAGLAAAHEAGVIHRDLKPGNIMVSEKNEALIMDFGLAMSATRRAAGGDPNREIAATDSDISARALAHTAVGAVMGTPRYMAPEQAKGLEVDEAADVYALGLIVREMLLGFTDLAGTPQVFGDKEKEPQSLRGADPAIPEALDAMVMKCLRPTPSERYRSASEVATALDQLDASGKRRPTARSLGPRGVTSVALLVLTLVAGSWEVSRRLSAPPTEMAPLPVLVADFENLTGEPMARGAIEEAMTIALGQSSFIDTYSRTAAHAFVDGLSPGSNLTTAMARLVSQREGIKVIVAGEVERERGAYRISARVLDAASQAEDAPPIAIKVRSSATREGLLAAVNRLAGDVRDSLGDVDPRTDEGVAAETFSAGSLLAMGAYARAQELNYQGHQQEALEAYKEAVELDPALGRAHAGMGAVYYALGHQEEGEASYREALKHLDRMTERERYRTLGGYYLGVARNYEKAVENFETLVKLFPADNAGHANLALASLYVHDLDRAVSEGLKAIEIYPGNALQRANYAMYCMYAGQFETAIKEATRVLESVPDEYALLTLALANVGLSRLDGAREAYRKLESTSGFGASMAAIGKADLEMLRGRYRAASTVLASAIEEDRREGRTANLAQKLVALGESWLARGNLDRAASEARSAIGLSHNENVLYPAARVLLHAGRIEEVEQLADSLEEQVQNQTRAYGELLRGEMAQRQGRLPDAIDLYRKSLGRSDTWFGRYMLAIAYLEADHPAEALAESQLCFKRRGEVSDVFLADTPTTRYLPQLEYWLARAQQGVGASELAQRGYRLFLTMRESADTPDPLVDNARQRLETPTG